MLKQTLLGLGLLTLTSSLAFAYTDEGRLPFTGAKNALPIAVVMDFMGHRLGENGKFDYRRLSINQVANHTENPTEVHITVIRRGMPDDSVDGNRYRFWLKQTTGNRWQITSSQEDFTCYRRHQSGYHHRWSTQPCQ